MEITKTSGILSLYFDRKRDDTIAQISGKRIKGKEKHIALIREPNSLFLGHVTPKSSSANEIKDAIFKSFPSNTFHHLKVIGCDGTVTKQTQGQMVD